VVISALERTLGKERIAWETAAVPDKPYVKLHVTYDPAQFDHIAIISAAKAAMEAHPDPAHPGPVRVVWRGRQDLSGVRDAGTHPNGLPARTIACRVHRVAPR
jgi:hypothetical protein